MANTTVKQSVANAGRDSLAWDVVKQLNAMAQCRCLRAPGLRIKGGSASPTAQNANTFEALVGGVPVQKASSDMAALVGTVTNGEYGAWLFTIDSGGTLGVTALATAATLAALVLPSVDLTKTVIGGLLVHPTGTGDFVGGTDDLDDATITPNAVFWDGIYLAGLQNILSFRETGVPA